MTPAELIEAAIEKGVPVFNDGDHGKCADIYAACLKMLAKDKMVEPSVRRALGDLIERSGKIENDTERAWILRTGLDHMYAAMAE